MPDARLYIEENVDPDHALARGNQLWQALDGNVPVSVYGAVLRGDAWVLGAHQRADQAIAEHAQREHTLLRRASGGIALRAGEGILYLALGLRDRSALMPCPRGRILNRNVRGALHGLRLAGVTAHYFGRDFVSVDARPATYVGWAAQADGRVLLEFFVCDQSSCWLPPEALGYPPRRDDPLRGKQPVTLAECGARASGRALLEALAEGYRAGFGAQWRPDEPASLPPLEAAASAQTHARVDRFPGLVWSYPLEEAIGFITAGVAIDAAGKLAQLQIGGDLFADEACADTLQRMLIGVDPTHDRIGRAVDAAYGQSGHDVDGVKDLHSFQAAILDAVARTRDVH